MFQNSTAESLKVCLTTVVIFQIIFQSYFIYFSHISDYPNQSDSLVKIFFSHFGIYSMIMIGLNFIWNRLKCDNGIQYVDDEVSIVYCSFGV